MAERRADLPSAWRRLGTGALVLCAVLERILAGQVGTFSIAGSRAWVEPRHERGHEQAQPTTEHAREVGLRNAHLLHLELKRGRAGLWFLPSMPIQLHPNTLQQEA